MVGLPARREDLGIVDLHHRLREARQLVRRARELAAKRRELYGLELQGAVREQEFGGGRFPRHPTGGVGYHARRARQTRLEGDSIGPLTRAVKTGGPWAASCSSRRSAD